MKIDIEIDKSMGKETKYKCKKCKLNDMSPNVTRNGVKGWVCNACGTINYPIRDSLKL